MGYRSYEWKIIYVLVIVFVLIQAGVFLGLSRQNEAIARETLEAELEAGSELLNRLLQLRHRQLEQSARVLAADVDLRDAILRNDLATAEELLRSHDGRITNAAMLLTDSRGNGLLSIAADRGGIQSGSLRFSPPDHSLLAREPLVALLDNSGILYQAITVPVSSTLPAGWLTLGLPTVNSMVQTLENVSNTQFAFLSRSAGSVWQEHGSTFPAEDLQVLMEEFSLAGASAQRLTAASGDYLVQPVLLHRFPDAELAALVGKSLEQAMQPFDRLQRNLFIGVLTGALISALAIFLISRRMIGPLSTMAHVDLLTGLANRRVFEQAVNQHVAAGNSPTAAREPPFGLMLMDMEGFRQINDQWGHTAGDEVLKVIADRLRDTLRKSDVISRYGGDEFAVLMPNADKESCAKVAEMILESLERKISVSGQDLEVGISIGVAIFPQDGRDRLTLLRKADLAMHAAQKSGRGFTFAGE